VYDVRATGPGLIPRRARRTCRLLAAAVGACVLAAAGGAGGFLGCAPPEDRDPVPRETPVLLFGTSLDGVLAACGCPGNPAGGFAKRQGLVERYRSNRRHVLLVDAGDLFPLRRTDAKVKYVALAAARAGYDAVALGEQELLLGADRLRRLRAEHGLPFVCSNVLDADGEPVVARHLVRDVGPLKVGILAVVADRTYGFPPVEWRKGYRVEPPVEAARREARLLAACDLVVAVSHQPLVDTRDLARQVPGLDVVLSGHDPITFAEPERAGDAVIVAAGDYGRIMGALAFERGEDGGWRFDFERTTLSARIPNADWVEGLYWKYVDEADVPVPAAWDTVVPPIFETAESCARCHPVQYKGWKETPHAHAYEVLEEAGRAGDPECLLCHTMGAGRSGGFESMRRTPELGRVTCQACHVVTSRHVEFREEADPRILINSRLCMSCHGPVQSPKFDYYVYKPKILHPPGPKAVEP
jgi:hypothetical protein